jgi:hypothetical protein
VIERTLEGVIAFRGTEAIQTWRCLSFSSDA